jgi:hypothetical protein
MDLNKKLNFIDILNLSKLLHDLEIDVFIEKILNEDFINDKTMSIANKLGLVITKIITHILINMHKCQDSILTYISVYTNLDINEVKKFDVDIIADVLTATFNNGVPKIIQSILNIEDIKKKMKLNATKLETI